MGWFLTGKKRQPGRRPGTKAAPGPKAWDPVRTLANIEALAAMAVLFAVLISWRFAQIYLTHDVHERQALKVGANQVDLDQPPRWMSAQVAREVRNLVAKSMTADPLDTAALERTAEALSRSPWVEKVGRIQRMTNGRVCVAAAYREPVAVVKTPDGLRLVDIKGILLPGIYPDNEGVHIGLPRIIGVTSSPPEQDGQLWPGGTKSDGDLNAGLSLISLLHGEPYIHMIHAYDVSGRDSRGRIRLVLKTAGGTINWGFPPGQERAIEADAPVKRAWLANIYRERHTIDAGGGGALDVYNVDTFSIPAHLRPPTTQDHNLAVGYTWSR